MSSIDASERQGKLPSKTIAWHKNWGSNVQLKMGVENQFESFQHEFQKMRLFMSDISLNLEAQKQGAFGGKSRFGRKVEIVKYDEKALDRINKIWYGKTYLVNKRNFRNEEKIDESIFSYDLSDARFRDSVVEFPALKDMCPLGRIDDLTWGLRLNIAIPAKYAFEGYSYDEIILFGKYFKKFADKTEPSFRDMDDIINGGHMVTYVGRIWWKKTIDILQKYWEKQHTILFVNQHRMLESEMKAMISDSDSEHNYVADATRPE